MNKTKKLNELIKLSIKRYQMEKDGRNILNVYLLLCEKIGKLKAEILFE